MLYVLSEQLCRRVISPFYLVKYPHAKITFDPPSISFPILPQVLVRNSPKCLQGGTPPIKHVCFPNPMNAIYLAFPSITTNFH